MAKYSFEFKKNVVTVTYLENWKRWSRSESGLSCEQKESSENYANGVVYYSYEELKSETEKYIKYYNEHRIKQKLGGLSPVQYRLSLLAA